MYLFFLPQIIWIHPKALLDGLMDHLTYTLKVLVHSEGGMDPLSRLRRGGAFGTNPLSLASLASSPEGGALGKEGRFRPYRSTAGRSQPISGKLYALAKASPFRERWHGEAVTERVAGFVLIGQRQEEVSR